MIDEKKVLRLEEEREKLFALVTDITLKLTSRISFLTAVLTAIGHVPAITAWGKKRARPLTHGNVRLLKDIAKRPELRARVAPGLFTKLLDAGLISVAKGDHPDENIKGTAEYLEITAVGREVLRLAGYEA